MNWKVIEKTGKPGALIRVVGVGGLSLIHI